ncbi:response regulator [Qipengyuania sp. MTN3-11]|uniref:response regulator n=1 Tax=Qipengyuania sp. MTN3-11 TaxID=3056557 RepID=UPI0036F413AC
MSLALIIEDEPLLAFALEDDLRELGYTSFRTATSEKQAIEAARDKCPDLILADHRIIGGTGTHAVLAICADRAISVVFVSASGCEIRERIPEALVVNKPFTFSELQTAVQAAQNQPFRYRDGQI